MEDPIVEEVRSIREAHAARFGFDIDAIFTELNRREQASGNACIVLEPKRLATPATGGANPRSVNP